MPATKSLRSGTWARTLLPRMRSARLPSPPAAFRKAAPKKSTRVGMPFSIATLSHIRGRLDTQHGDTQGREMLQQIAVIAGQLDREATGAQSEPAAIISQ